MRVPLSQVPLDLRRRTAQRLESLRGTEMGVGSARAALAPEVCPLFRPDLDNVAYYEFELLGVSRLRSLATPEAIASGMLERREGRPAARPERNGFVIASAGAHDFPIPHWSFESAPPSRLLDELASAEGREVARVYKLDALCYVAESADGEAVGTVGDVPKLVAGGLPFDLSRARGRIGSMTARPAGSVDDGAGDAIEHRVERAGDVEARLEFTEVESWAAFKERYGDAVGPFLEELRRRAAEAWEVDRLVEEFGEGIVVGETHRVALLEDQAVVDVAGSAAPYVEVRIIHSEGASVAVELRAVSFPPEPDAALELRLAYGSGEEERLQFFVASREKPSSTRGERPPGAEA